MKSALSLVLVSALAVGGMEISRQSDGEDVPTTKFGVSGDGGGYRGDVETEYETTQELQPNNNDPVPASPPSRVVGVRVEPGADFEFAGPDQLCMESDADPLGTGPVPCYGRDTSDDTDDEEPDPEPDAPEFVVISVSASDFAELPLVPAQVRVQPEQSWTMVNVDTIAYASGDPQVLTTQVLGFEVAVRAAPVEFSWDFGDGSDPVVTTDPGLPYPDHTVAHAYTAVADERRVALTTTWVGEFQVAGAGPWIPIAGTAQTVSVSEAFEVVEVTTRLVPGPQAGQG